MANPPPRPGCKSTPASRVHIQLEDDLLAALDRRVAEENTSRSDYVRRVLRAHLSPSPTSITLDLPEELVRVFSATVEGLGLVRSGVLSELVHDYVRRAVQGSAPNRETGQ